MKMLRMVVVGLLLALPAVAGIEPDVSVGLGEGGVAATVGISMPFGGGGRAQSAERMELAMLETPGSVTASASTEELPAVPRLTEAQLEALRAAAPIAPAKEPRNFWGRMADHVYENRGKYGTALGVSVLGGAAAVAENNHYWPFSKKSDKAEEAEGGGDYIDKSKRSNTQTDYSQNTDQSGSNVGGDQIVNNTYNFYPPTPPAEEEPAE